jgi:undecaprenyl diphosphate synthase
VLILPNHLAVIMDGNGRWAKARRHHRSYGHIRGAVRAKEIIEECARLKIPRLTLFTFSTENWQRPASEVSLLMRLLIKRLRKERASLMKNNIRFECIGNLDRLPRFVLDVVKETIAVTAHNTGMTLVFALSYGGRQDITFAMRELAQKVLDGRLLPDAITDEHITQSLATGGAPDPDLIIRTSGESRFSNFFLWQAAYSEFYVCDQLWPDFSAADLLIALQSFASRERRFGKTGEQLQVMESRWPRSQPG